MRYLKSFGQLSWEREKTGTEFLKIGYQNLLRMNNSDGSFSFWHWSRWNPYKYEPSIWLTAYTAKLLYFVESYISVSPKLIINAFNYVARQQQPDGSFPLTGYDYFSYKSGNSVQDIPLTAFCAIVYLENQNYKTSYQYNINQALSYLKTKLRGLKDNYALAISAYAFALSNDKTTKDKLLEELKDNANINDNEMYWDRIKGARSWFSLQVQTAAYALMAFDEVNRTEDAVKVMNWIMKVRNKNGGFSNSIETVLGMEALAKIAKKLYVRRTNVEVKLTDQKGRQEVININPSNAMALQVREFKKDTKQITANVKFTGQNAGFAYVQVSYRYNTMITESANSFAISVLPSTNGNGLTLQICTNLISENSGSESGMTLIEVYLPSGYVYDPQTAAIAASVGVRVSRTRVLVITEISDY
jgi:CD109 antigen